MGYLAFTFFYLQSAKLFWRLLVEIQAGTLEQVYLSPLPAWLVATAGRVLATVIETAIVVSVLYVVVFAITQFARVEGLPVSFHRRASPLMARERVVADLRRVVIAGAQSR